METNYGIGRVLNNAVHSIGTESIMPDTPADKEQEERTQQLEKPESERREAVEGLETEGAFLSAVLDNIEEAIVICDKQGRLLRFNEAARRLHGLPEQPISADQWAEHYDLYRMDGVTPLPKEAIPLFRALQGEHVRNAEIVVSPKSDSPRSLICNGQALVDETGAIIGAAVAMHDITERKEAEKALRESEERFRFLSDASFEGILIHDKGKILDANQSFAEMFGYEINELIGMNVLELTAPEWRDVVKGNMLSGIEEAYEAVGLRKDGSTFPGELRGKETEDRGRKVRIIALRDLSRERKTEEALLESEEKYRSILETIEDGYYEVDLAGNLTFFNDSLCKILGYSRDELMGMNNREYTDEENARKVYKAFNRVFTTGMPEKGSGWELIRKDGTKRHIETSISLRRDAQGQPVGFRGIARDITEQKQLEAQFQQAQKMESIGTLAGGIAHNFNNVLMGIQGRTSLMMIEKDPSDPDYEHLQGIEQNIKIAAELTRDLLGFARGGKYEVRATELNTLIRNESRMFSQTRKEIRIHEKYEEDLWSVKVDRGQIQQVLLNLYVNASQAMPGGGDLYVRTDNVTFDEKNPNPFEGAPGEYVRVSVTDTGVGMDEKTKERIFEPFFTTQKMGRGTGLGLSSVYGIIKNHGGFINVHTEKGKGTTFDIYLPASTDDLAEKGAPETRDEVKYGQETILLVDDEDMVISVGQKMLEKLGYRVLTARSGEEALEVFTERGEHIDLVILDMIMPGMGGGAAYDRMKEMDKGVRVLLSSGYSIDGEAEEILDRGCMGFIQKPFDMKELSNKIKEAFGQGD